MLIDGHFLVVGLGSIGQRHAQVAKAAGVRVSAVSRRGAPLDPCDNIYPTVEDAIRSAERYAGVIVANETALHQDTLLRVRRAGFSGPVLLEKPIGLDHGSVLAASAPEAENVWVGYNLRFHPGLLALREWCAGKSVISASVRVGQNLGSWRPARNAAETYSARRDAGGGVLRDLSHELDYLAWLFGPVGRVVSLGGRMGGLTVDSDDCWAILMELSRCPVLSLAMDYLDHIGLRQIVVNASDDSAHLDLITGELRTKGGCAGWKLKRNDTYRAQFLAFAGSKDHLCTYVEGIGVMGTIAAIEAANLK